MSPKLLTRVRTILISRFPLFLSPPVNLSRLSPHGMWQRLGPCTDGGPKCTPRTIRSILTVAGNYTSRGADDWAGSDGHPRSDPTSSIQILLGPIVAGAEVSLQMELNDAYSIHY